jgi:uncharacterized protein YjbI with pentapeptide repeats
MKKSLAFFLICLFLIFGCTINRPSIEEATAEGATQLSKQNIKDLVMNNDLQMVSWDLSVKAMIQFARAGKLTAKNNVGEATHGRWSASDENKLCLKFKFWDDNVKRCYKVYKDNDTFLLYRNGVLENRLLPSAEVLGSLPDMNSGVMGAPPQQLSSAPATKTVVTPAPTPTPQAEAGGSFLSTVTFGLLGDDEKQVEEAPLKEAEVYIPEPMVPEKLLSAPHQQLLDTGDCPGCDLQNLDLKGLKLKGANLAGANLEGANLQETNLKGANLKGANLISVRLTDAILIKADLQGANLSDANLHWADLTKADLRGANLTRCYMIKANFYKANLTGADFTGAQTQRTIFEKAEGVPEHILNRGKDMSDPLKQ